MPDVFISHSSRDGAMAEALATRIREFGLSVFLDSVSIHPGEDWTRVIHQNLLTSPVVLLLATKNGIASPTVNQEIGMAIGKGRTIIPILVDVLSTELPAWTDRYQALILTGKTEPEINAQIAKLLQRLVDEKQKRNVATLAVAALAIWALLGGAK
jgi:hypothetical protein